VEHRAFSPGSVPRAFITRYKSSVAGPDRRDPPRVYRRPRSVILDYYCNYNRCRRSTLAPDPGAGVSV